MKKYTYLLFILLLHVLLACQNSKEKPDINFYYWKTIFRLDSTEKKALTYLETKKLYLRLFDIDYHPEKGAIPVGIAEIIDTTSTFDVVGVVFITNRTMIQIPSDRIEDLAEKIFRKISLQTQKMPLKELQLDCDWSERSQKNFFVLCKALKKRFQSKHIPISATIRLHQYKYTKETGIPPVDAGVLMLYNVGDINGSATENSILELKKVEQYLDVHQKYPLKLRVALPIFGWGIVQREGKTVHLLSQISEQDLMANANSKKITKNTYQVSKNHYFGGVYLYEQDVLRWESVDVEILEKLTSLVARKILTKEIILYHLDSKNLTQKKYEKFKNLPFYWL